MGDRQMLPVQTVRIRKPLCEGVLGPSVKLTG
jgi:hypothetical protein